MLFHYFTLEEIYKYAEKLGYSHDRVSIEDCSEKDTETGEIYPCFYVKFGREWFETWEWVFEDLSQSAIEYEHYTWND